MTRKDIGLVMCPMWDTNNPQLGLPLLKAHLNSLGFSAFTLDLAIRIFKASSGIYRDSLQTVDGSLLVDPRFVRRMFSHSSKTVETSLEELLDSGAKVFGFSLYYCTLRSVIEFATMIKKRDPSRIIVLGGPECMRLKSYSLRAYPNDSRWFDVVDALVPGEGETVLPDLLENAKTGRLGPCRGAYVKSNGNFEWTGSAPELADLDSLPFADFSDYRLEDYSQRQLVTYMSRGCIRLCTFCDVRFYWGNYRTRSGRRVFEEISYQLRRYPATNSIWFCDSIINADMKQLEEFCDLMIAAKKNGSPSVKWRAYAIIRPEMTKSFLQKMAEAGCDELHIGIESGSQKILNSMRKGFRRELAEDVLRNVHTAGINATMLLMVGFPGETETDFQETLGFMRRAGQYAARISPSESLTYLGVGTELHTKATTHYEVDPSDLHADYWRTKDGLNTYPERVRRFKTLCEEATRLGLRLAPKAEAVSRDTVRMRESYDRHLRKIEADRLTKEAYLRKKIQLPSVEHQTKKSRSFWEKMSDAVCHPIGALRYYHDRGKAFWREKISGRYDR